MRELLFSPRVSPALRDGLDRPVQFRPAVEQRARYVNALAGLYPERGDHQGDDVRAGEWLLLVVMRAEVLWLRAGEVERVAERMAFTLGEQRLALDGCHRPEPRQVLDDMEVDGAAERLGREALAFVEPVTLSG